MSHRWTLTVWTAMVGWSAALFSMVRSDYLEFRLARFDLGNMVQAVWSTAHGHLLEMTNPDGEQITRLATHVDPILVLFAPLWIVAPTPLTLAAVQIVAVASGALPVFWLARRHLSSEKMAALLALAYLAYPWLSWTADDAMHPATLAIPLFLYAIWFLDTDRLWAFGVCAVLVVACGEAMGLTLAALGLWYGITYRRTIRGLVIVAAGLLATGLALEVVIPVFRGGPSPYYAHYEDVGGSPGHMLRTAFTHPGTFLSAITSSGDLNYVLLLAAPLTASFLLSPGLAAVALPRLLENMLSDRPATVDPRAHYIDAVIPLLVAATVFGLARLSPARRLRAVVAVLAVCAASFVLVGHWGGTLSRPPFRYTDSLPAARIGALREALALIPNGVPVSASNDVGAHLATRRYAYTVPVVGKARWVLVDTSDPAVPAFPVSRRDPQRIRRFVASIEQSARWRKIFDRQGVLVFRQMTSA